MVVSQIVVRRGLPRSRPASPDGQTLALTSDKSNAIVGPDAQKACLTGRGHVLYAAVPVGEIQSGNPLLYLRFPERLRCYGPLDSVVAQPDK
jgi:hypothetical protein